MAAPRKAMAEPTAAMTAGRCDASPVCGSVSVDPPVDVLLFGVPTSTSPPSLPWSGAVPPGWEPLLGLSASSPVEVPPSSTSPFSSQREQPPPRHGRRQRWRWREPSSRQAWCQKAPGLFCCGAWMFLSHLASPRGGVAALRILSAGDKLSRCKPVIPCRHSVNEPFTHGSIGFTKTHQSNRNDAEDRTAKRLPVAN